MVEFYYRQALNVKRYLRLIFQRDNLTDPNEEPDRTVNHSPLTIELIAGAGSALDPPYRRQSPLLHLNKLLSF
jgi:hypothetical protein